MYCIHHLSTEKEYLIKNKIINTHVNTCLELMTMSVQKDGMTAFLGILQSFFKQTVTAKSIKIHVSACGGK